MWIAIGLTVVCAWLVRPARSRRRAGDDPLFTGTGSQWKRNYGRRSFLRLGAAIVVSGALAWSGADEAFDRAHSGRVRSGTSDKLAWFFKQFGERYWFLNWAIVAGIDAWLRTSGFSRWGRSNFEAMCVGLPTLWIVQRGLGANRPSSDDASPRWRPLRADNSASGHTFIAAIPWLQLARRSGAGTNRILARCASTLTGWSRINDRKHYLGQVVLGWVIAWNAVEATGGTDNDTGEEDR